jgi:hypothetical protein
MTMKRSLLIALAALFALAFNLYLAAQQFWNHATKADGRLAAADKCEPGDSALQGPKVNPNKMLFISCGGFLD